MMTMLATIAHGQAFIKEPRWCSAKYLNRWNHGTSWRSDARRWYFLWLWQANWSL